MYLNDFQRSNFYESIGLDARKYDIQVIRKTNESASRIFPIALDVDKPEFFQYLDICASQNKLLIEIERGNSNKIIKLVNKINISIRLGINLIKLYLIKPIESSSVGQTIK